MMPPGVHAPEWQELSCWDRPQETPQLELVRGASATDACPQFPQQEARASTLTPAPLEGGPPPPPITGGNLSPGSDLPHSYKKDPSPPAISDLSY